MLKYKIVKIKFIAENESALDAPMSITFQIDNTASLEEMNNFYTKFLKAIGYSILEDIDTIDDPFEELEEESAGYASDELEF